MKVAIPTDDGLHISDKCAWASGFLIAGIEQGKIITEEIRQNPGPDGQLTTAFGLIRDCQIIITTDLTSECRHLQQASEKEIVLVSETIITNVLSDYLKDRFLKESNTCCCP